MTIFRKCTFEGGILQLSGTAQVFVVFNFLFGHTGSETIFFCCTTNQQFVFMSLFVTFMLKVLDVVEYLLHVLEFYSTRS